MNGGVQHVFASGGFLLWLLLEVFNPPPCASINHGGEDSHHPMHTGGMRHIPLLQSILRSAHSVRYLYPAGFFPLTNKQWNFLTRSRLWGWVSTQDNRVGVQFPREGLELERLLRYDAHLWITTNSACCSDDACELTSSIEGFSRVTKFGGVD